MLTANVFFYDELVGTLSKDGESTYIFQYLDSYVKKGSDPISFGLPVTNVPYISDHLHGFFSGLLSEGWLRHAQATAKRIDENDEFSLLMHYGQDVSGAVSVELQDLP